MVLEVTLGHGGDVLAAEDAHLELLRLVAAGGYVRLALVDRRLEVVERLEDHLLCANVLCDICLVSMAAD